MPSHESVNNFNSIPIVGIVPEQGTSAPATTVEGRLLTNTALHVLMVVLNGLAKTLATTDDGRFTDSRPPNGAAGGDLTGTYPNPTIGSQKVLLANLALGLIQTGLSSGTALTTDPALRALGFGSNSALAGTTPLSAISAPVADVSLATHKITNLLDGTNPQDAVSLAQLQGAVQGLDAKASVRAATTAAITLSGPQTIDGVAVVAGNRVLVKNQASGSAQGIYVAAAGAWARATDMDTAAECNGAFTFVEEGFQAGSGWVQNQTIATIGTDPMLWVQFSSVGSYIGGAGLTLTGLTFDVNVDAASLQIVADVLSVKALGILNSMIANGTIDLTTKVTGVLPVANGGTGGSSASAARTAGGFTFGFAGTSPALTAGVYADVVHSLGIRAKTVTIVTATGEDHVEMDWRNKSGSETSTIQIKIDIPAGRAIGFYLVYVTA